jgi:photosystem II stability/assembly factor-like uncharacterized protein
MKKLQLFFLLCLALLLVACDNGGGGGQNTSASPTAQPVNGFGSAANHIHSLVVLPDANHTLVLATHYGIFRSQDHGSTWQETAGGPGQLMRDVMTYYLSYNLIDPQRLYVLTAIRTAQSPSSELGLYTSSDGGKTWHMSITQSSITSSLIFFAQAGNDNPNEVYIYLRELGPLGLRVSMDNGQHFSQAGAQLPFGNVLGLLPIPNEPGHLLVYGNDGVASTSDGGAHWQLVSNVQDSIFEMTTPGPNAPIYARGDNGIYVSQDGGKTFTPVYTQQSFASLSASPQQPQTLYGKLGLGVYRSTNGGKSWSKMPAIQQSQQSLTGDVLVADPTDPNQVYLGISYPVVAYHFQSGNDAWKSITPPV